MQADLYNGCKTAAVEFLYCEKFHQVGINY